MKQVAGLPRRRLRLPILARYRAKTSVVRGMELLAIGVVFLTRPSRASLDPPPDPQSPAPTSASHTPSPFDNLGRNTIDAFTGTNLVLHGAAFVSTPIMAFGGADHEIRVQAQSHAHAKWLSEGTRIGGWVAPVFVAGSLYVWGLASTDPVLTGAGAAVTQALGLTMLSTGLLKWATGRPFPTHGGDPNDPLRLEHDEYAREFSLFPSLRRGALAWPSGHTSSAVSIAAALSAYYPEHPAVAWITYPIAATVGLGMIIGDHHWASDVLAGGLMGQAIGYSVGRNFRRDVCKDDSKTSRPVVLAILPMMGAKGLMLNGTW